MPEPISLAQAAASLAAKLSRGESLDDIGRQLLPEHWTPALQAASVARYFDAKTYRAVLVEFAGDRPPALSELMANKAVEELPGGQLQVPDAHRSAYFLSWLGDTGGTGPLPAKLLELEMRLSEHWHARGRPAERLRHLILADPESAGAYFERQFAANDARRDFGRCQDLILVLADPDRAPLTKRTLLRRAETRAGYLRARTHWAQDYARSAQFLQPDGLWGQAKELLYGPGPRVWQMHGPAGSGKTMQLRWLVSRRCVTPELDVTCARIDFDHVDPLNGARWPWLLLLELADQLELRLPARAFTGLDEYAAYRSLLADPNSPAAAEAARGIRTQDEARIRDEAVEAFISRFNQSFAADLPVLVVVDTMEEVLLRSPSHADGLLRLLGEVLERCPAIRLVVAGRAPLAGGRHDAAFAALGPYQDMPVLPFTEGEAQRYLREIRGINEPELLRVVIDRSAGMPFHLALFADDVDQNPDVSPEELQTLRTPLLSYLVNRVVRRIDDPVVRWLLRYGVIPRRLRREHVESILKPHLEQITDDDDPRHDAHHLPGRQDVFPAIAPPSTKQLEDAWRKLLDYAATSSWITEVTEDERSVVFHSAVLQPMRDLISDRPVFAQLHRNFAERFEQLAGETTHPERRIRYLREALYHRFQMRDSDAPRRWREELERAWAAGDTQGLRGLAEEILGDEYVERDSPRRIPGGDTLITYELMAEAQLNLAYALFREGMTDGVPSAAHDHIWSDVELCLAKADDLYKQAGITERAHSVREEVLQATVLALGDRAGEAVYRLEHRVLAYEGLPELERLWALSIRAASLRLLHSAAAAQAYQEVVAFARSARRPDIAASAAATGAGEHRLLGEVDAATELYALAAELRTEAELPVFPALAQQAGLLLRCRRPAAALAILDLPKERAPAPPADQAALARLQAKAQLQLGREAEALAALQRADAVAGLLHGAQRYRQLALTAQLRGVALGELQEIGSADDCFTRATGLWTELGYLAGEPECHYLYARFLLRDSQDLAAAHRVLEPYEAPGQEPEFALRLQLLIQEWAVRSGVPRSGQAPPLSYGTLPGLVRPLHALCRIAGDDGPAADPDAIRELADALGDIQPVQARLATLRDLADNPALRGRVDWAELEPYFGACVPDPGAYGPDDALAQLMIAQVRGHADAAGLERAARVLIDSAHGNRQIVWRCARIAARLGHPGLACTWLAEVPWTQPPKVAGGAPRPPHVRLALSALVMDAGVNPRPREAEDALRRAIQLAESGGVVRHSVPVTLLDCARRVQVTGVVERVEELLRRLQRPAFDGPDADGQRLFQDWPGEQVLQLHRQPGIDPVDDAAPPRPGKLAAWHEQQRPLRDELSRPQLRRPRYVRLDSDDPAAHALPWEMTLQPALEVAGKDDQPVMYRTLPGAARQVDVCWLQHRLNRLYRLRLDVDGIVGPETRQALDRLQPGALTAGWPLVAPETRRELQRLQPHDPGPHRVLVVSTKPDAPASGATSGGQSPLTYWLRGRRPSLGGYPARLLTFQPDAELAAQLGPPPEGLDILHLAAPLRQRGGVPYLEFSPAGHARRLAGKARGSDLFPVHLSRWLAEFDPGRVPVVVLDPPYPGSEVDTAVQLTLRNLFAAHLFSHGNCPAVVCTGVFPEGGLEHLLGFYADLDGHATLAEATRKLRSTARGSGTTAFADDDDARRATALYAAASSLLHRPKGPPPVTPVRTTVRQAGFRNVADGLARELETWIRLSEGEGAELEKHHSQLLAVSRMLGSGLELARESQALPLVLDLHHVWDYFRGKFALRRLPESRDFLAAADELAWACYRAPLQAALAADGAAGTPPKEPPLVSFSRTAAPRAHRRGDQYRELLPRGGIHTGEGARAARNLPFPVIDIPWYYASHLPALLTVAHEVGHHIEDDFGLTGELRERLAGCGLPAAELPRWQGWLGEVFADVCATLACGVAYPQVLGDVLAALEPPEDAGEAGDAAEHPPAAVRLRVCEATLEAAGHPAVDLARADAAGSAELVAEALVGRGYPQFGGKRLPELLPVPGDLRLLRDRLIAGRATGSRQVTGVLAAAALAFAADPDGYDRRRVAGRAVDEVLALRPVGRRASPPTPPGATEERDAEAGRRLLLALGGG
ncbi:hypothetical protein G5C51_18110 [Streptomyces sp. A7024]|uniref:Uncharacterized protein n=1 Tax=Streptomyces coryli TaxID=1128680 RepID=A0A6G4U3J7_9ACTN|nr:hypothetical protein [Streptomyces coryli]NGN65801.1 hypothetical protein [Streptomyces coryli]